MNGLITGATSGLGRRTAEALAAKDVNLLLTGRNARVGRRIAARLQRRHPHASIVFVPADLSRWDEVRALAAAAADRFEQLDVLVNNAGARSLAYHENDTGLERTFAANHLGHFLLTILLADRLVRAPGARVVTLTSGAHRSVTGQDGWYLPRDAYDGSVAYAKSKLANLVFAFELARRLARTRVASNAANPGIVATNFERNNGLRTWLGFLVGHGLKRRLVLPRTGAAVVVHLASSPQVAGLTGRYFTLRGEAEPSAVSRDRETARRLWDLSLELTGAAGDPSAGPWLR